MRQLKEAMDKEARYGELIHSLTSGSGGYGEGEGGGSSNSSPEKGMGGSKSTSHIGKKKKVRERAITTGTAELTMEQGGHGSRTKGKLPKLTEKKQYRHNHTKAFHCFN